MTFRKRDIESLLIGLSKQTSGQGNIQDLTKIYSKLRRMSQNAGYNTAIVDNSRAIVAGKDGVFFFDFIIDAYNNLCTMRVGTHQPVEEAYFEVLFYPGHLQHHMSDNMGTAPGKLVDLNNKISQLIERF